MSLFTSFSYDYFLHAAEMFLPRERFSLQNVRYNYSPIHTYSLSSVNISKLVIAYKMIFFFNFSCTTQIIIIYEDFLSAREANEPQISEKGVLQILLDLRFASDILSGGDASTNVEIQPKITMNRSAFRRKQGQQQTKSVNVGRIDGVISQLTQKLDPIDWLT